MKRIAMFATTVGLIIVGMTCERAGAVNPVNTVKWVGAASGQWNDANAWKNTTTNVTANSSNAAIFNQGNGSDGMNNVNPALTRARNIIIDGGATVNYSGSALGDFRVKQGSNLTITAGATWVQTTDSSYNGNNWTNMDASNLVLDNGTFRRTGETHKSNSTDPDGGGALILGDYRGDDNYGTLGLNSTEINVAIKNGGKIENQGQLWFGCQDETPSGLRVRFNINNGSLNLTGGTIAQSDDSFDTTGDLQFYHDYDEVGAVPKNEQYEINFTGPGSITVQSAGIKVYTQDSSSVWNTGAALSTYEDLWNLGLLKANGLSGATPSPATFSNFFTTSGTAGSANYTLTSITNPIATVKWVGAASGQWNDANAWKNLTTNTTANSSNAAIFNQGNGSDGMNTVDPATTRARSIVIDGGATVNYNGSALGDLRIRQGTNVTITGGATLVQATDSSYNGNNWTQMDPSNLVIDNGTLRRSGETHVSNGTANDGGGVILFGSYRADANFNQLGVGSAEINVTLKNGGKIENTGQLWFGAQEEHPADIRIKFTINNGSMDLTGGTIAQSNDSFDATGDLQFYYDYDEVNAKPKNEKYEINFTGPGSITVDSAGIKVFTQDSSSIWNTGAAPSTYQDLWTLGILKANGLSGATTSPANFNDFFTVTGTAGTDNYILNSLIAATVVGVPGDYNNNGVVDAADYVLWRKGGPLQNEVDTPGTVNAADYTAWRARFGNTSGSGASLGAAAVPEPGTILLTIVGLASICAVNRRKRHN
jgi:hypothetical protein